MRVLLRRTSAWPAYGKIIEIEEEKFFEYLKNLQLDEGYQFVVDTNGIDYEFGDKDVNEYHSELIKRYEDELQTRMYVYGKRYVIPCDVMVEIYDDYRE